MKAQSKSYRQVTYEFPFVYPSRNITENMNPLKRGKLKEKFMEDVRMEILNQLGIVRFLGQVKIAIDLCFTNKRRRDLDNFSPKWLLDALVKCGIILDDNKDIIPESPDVMILEKEPEEKMIVQIQEI